MIKVYGCSAPNPKKISIFLEEAGLDYEYVSMNLYEGQQKTTEYLAINPNGRFPAVVDADVDGEPITVWESGAILTYLAEKTGKFLPAHGAGRYEVLQWVYWQVSHAPYMGNAHLYRIYIDPPREFEIKRFTNESARLYRLLDRHLADREWMAAGEFTIADMALFPWVEYHEWHGQDLNDFPNVKAWFERMAIRPGVAKGRTVPYPAFEFKPSEVINYEEMNAMIAARLNDPAFAIKADPLDQAVAGIAKATPVLRQR